MLQDIQKELAGLDITRQSLRSFGLLLGGVFSLSAGVLFWKSSQHWLWPAIMALILLLTTQLYPLILARPYRLWMLLAFVLGWIMTRIILTAAYMLIMTPIGWLLRALDKDILDERIDKASASYWKNHESVSDRGRYKKQF
jgi:Saxitoxin biosynthesis operon protein SxtJ